MHALQSRLVAVLVAASLFAISLPLRASDTPAPASVAIAGSLQSELGCPGDWQPECAVTDLSLE